ncbi:MAG: hypothetical protein DWQ19_10785 [Crenarchaeota archaeon]|nr:MAG: hypothetical protein DWQ19_10785 [Thermoproteota archaeon]
MIDLIVDFDEKFGFTLRRSNQEDISSFSKDGFQFALKCAKKIVRHSGYDKIVITKEAAKMI